VVRVSGVFERVHVRGREGTCFDEQGKLNQLAYRAAHRLYLRNILFNNPHLPEIRLTYPNDGNRWNEWLRRMKAAATGINHPEFEFIKGRFHSFEDFCEVVHWCVPLVSKLTVTSVGHRSLFFPMAVTVSMRI